MWPRMPEFNGNVSLLISVVHTDQAKAWNAGSKQSIHYSDVHQDRMKTRKLERWMADDPFSQREKKNSFRPLEAHHCHWWQSSSLADLHGPSPGSWDSINILISYTGYNKWHCKVSTIFCKIGWLLLQWVKKNYTNKNYFAVEVCFLFSRMAIMLNVWILSSVVH